MISLRVKLALLLITLITTVVVLVTIAALGIVKKPRIDHFAKPVAWQLSMLADLAENYSFDGSVYITRFPPVDEARRDPKLDDLTAAISTELAALGHPRQVQVVRRASDHGIAAAALLNTGEWLTVPLPNFGPPDGPWPLLISWISLLILAATALGIYLARRLIRPLSLIQRAAASISEGGHVLPLPESGPEEIRAMARAVNRLSRKLKEAMESRMRLVAAAGHDLRTPITRLRLRAEFLPEPERGRWIADLEELACIADSSMELVREETCDSHAQVFRLDTLAREVRDEITDLGYGIVGYRDTAVSVAGGYLGLKRALRNLIINAATYGGGARVEIAAASGRATIIIEDDGVGIPADMLERAFEPFFRVDQARRKVIPGAGLGLAIARAIITRYGGTIRLENKPSGGLRQCVSLPSALSQNSNIRMDLGTG
jgi:signal transduction histidine kinase